MPGRVHIFPVSGRVVEIDERTAEQDVVGKQSRQMFVPVTIITIGPFFFSVELRTMKPAAFSACSRYSFDPVAPEAATRVLIIWLFGPA